MRARVTFYHNPRCSKSREALRLLRAHDVDLDVVEYLKTPLSLPELENLLHKLEIEPEALMRRQEPAWREAGLDQPGVGRTVLLEALAREPRLMERPVAVCGARAVIGRPPTSVLQILDES